MKNCRSEYCFPLLYKAVIILTAGVICRCSPALYIPSASDQESAGIALDSLKLGRLLYIKHCSSCHNLHLPEQFTAAEWEKNVVEMQEKAKINDLQKETLLNYLKVRSRK
jgi:hypothetical protein